MKNTKNTHNDVGFLLYNIPTPTLDYTKIATICVRHLKHHMPNIPVAVCGQPVNGADIHIPIDQVKNNKRTYVHKSQTHKETWYNLTRDRSLEVTPFERTVLLDSDYIVQTNQLELLFKSDSPIMMYDTIYNIKEDLIEVEYLGDTRIPLKWATVLAFDHSDISRQLFVLWQKVLTNYKYYELLYGWRADGTVWNDKAITIAHQQLTGYCANSKQYIIPWHHPFASFSCDVEHIGLDKIILRDQKSFFQVFTDVHILNKQELL
jgi:hypothetical protein